jgi:hypothetical protein
MWNYDKDQPVSSGLSQYFQKTGIDSAVNNTEKWAKIHVAGLYSSVFQTPPREKRKVGVRRSRLSASPLERASARVTAISGSHCCGQTERALVQGATGCHFHRLSVPHAGGHFVSQHAFQTADNTSPPLAFRFERQSLRKPHSLACAFPLFVGRTATAAATVPCNRLE